MRAVGCRYTPVIQILFESQGEDLEDQLDSKRCHKDVIDDVGDPVVGAVGVGIVGVEEGKLDACDDYEEEDGAIKPIVYYPVPYHASIGTRGGTRTILALRDHRGREVRDGITVLVITIGAR